MKRAACLVLTAALLGCARPPASTWVYVPAPAPVIRDQDVWTFQAYTGSVITTDHYRLFTTETNPILRTRLPAALELAMDRYTTALAPLAHPARPLETYVMDSRPQWERLTVALAPRHAATYLQIRRGGFAADTRSLLFDIGVQDTVALAAHEGWHQFTQATFRDPLPVYLEEGIATWMEGYRWDPAQPDRPLYLPWANAERFDQLRSAQRAGTLFSIADLADTRPQDLLQRVDGSLFTWYAQAWALIHFLEEHDGGKYAGALRALLIDAQTARVRTRLAEALGPREAARAILSRRGTTIVETFINADLDALDAEYQTFIARITAVGSKERITQGQSPLTD